MVKKIAIIGSGPRGISILERLISRYQKEYIDENIEIFLIDDSYVGTGRIWSPNQSKHLLMNTYAKEITAFSGTLIDSNMEACAGNGPTFYQWWINNYDDFDYYKGYAPRKYYGEYLLYVLRVIESSLPKNIFLYKKISKVVDMTVSEERQKLYLSNKEILDCHKTVMATGHSNNDIEGNLKDISDACNLNQNLSFLQSYHLNDNNILSQIKADENIGILGLGLSFYDVMAELTLGRGGIFEENVDGTLNYLKSGKEPKIFASSRSGVPMPARGRNQKTEDYHYTPAIFTKEKALEIRGEGNAKFDKEVLPLIEAEISLVYAETLFKNKNQKKKAKKLRELVVKQEVNTPQGVQTFCNILGLNEIVSINLYNWKYPFQNCKFQNITQYNKQVTNLIHNDVSEAIKGNIDSPKKASLDILRNIRNVIRIIVDYGGIDPKSYNNEFLRNFDSSSKFLSTGPPLNRLLQLEALIKAGIINIVGPNIQYQYNQDSRKIEMFSENVLNSKTTVTTFIDARVPNPSIQKDNSIFIKNLKKRNIITPFVNFHKDYCFETSGINITESPYHPINKHNKVLNGIYIIGIPTEYTRWFMQSGSTRPNKWIDFMIDADAIAKDIINYCIKEEVKI